MRRDGNMGISLFPPGTPIINTRAEKFRAAEFSWRAPAGLSPTSFQIDRAPRPGGPFSAFDVSGTEANFPIEHLGEQNIFQIRANYPSGAVRSAPFAMTSLRNDNLIVNGAFEQNDNSHWDKWFSGDIPWERMSVTADSLSGSRAMEIKLVNDSSQSSITQYSHYGVPESYLKTVPGTLYSFGGYIRSGGLSAASEHWFEWDSSRTGEHPEARPGLPWPSYFTPSLKVGAAPSAWTYLNRVFTMPAGFPNVELRHRFTIQGRASGSVFLDNIFFCSLPAMNDPRWLDLMPFGQRWRYMVNAPPANWFATDFNDSSWPEGPAKLGAGSGPQNIRTSLTAKKPAYHFRRTFTLTTTTNLSTLLLAAICTDDYGGTVYPMRLFINGTEIIAPIEAVTGEGNEVKYFDLTPFTGLFLPDGPNVLGVIVQNTWQPDWDNVAFDVALKGIAMEPTLQIPRVLSIARGIAGSIMLTLAAPANSTWTLQSSENLTAWSFVQPVTFDSNGAATTTQNGQNMSARFYRLTSP